MKFLNSIIFTIALFVFHIKVEAQTYATLPFTDDFSSGSLGTSWATSATDPAGTIAVLNLTGGFPKFGTTTDIDGNATAGNGLAIYNTSDLGSGNSINLIQYLNLENKELVTTSFSLVDWGSGYYNDVLNIYFSNDGGSSYGAIKTTYNLYEGDYSDGVWNNITIDISAIATANSLSLNATSVLKYEFKLKGAGNTASPKTGNQFIYLDNFKSIGSTIVPVNLFSFIGKKIENGNQLNWETATELNNDYFELQRSIDGINFEKVAEIKGNITTNDISSYSYFDNFQSNGTVYYRLKQVDLNGHFEFLKIISISSNFNDNFEIYQLNENHIAIKGLEIETFDLFDLNGKLLTHFNLDVNKENQDIYIENNLKPGIYIVKIVKSNTIISKKLVFS